MTRITVEECIDKFPSRFELVLVASQRARKLHSGDTPTVEKDNDKNTVIALREIADSTLTVDQMKENLIQEYQTITISDEEEENLELEIDEKSENEPKTSIEEDLKTQEIVNEDYKVLNNSESNNEIEEEISNLVSSDDSVLEENLEITDDLDNSGVVSDNNKENSEILE